MIMIDTDIIIWILRGKEEIRSRLENYIGQYDGQIFITPIQIAEIYAGLRDAEKTRTDLFLDTLIVIDINGKVGKLSGEFVNIYSKSHNVTLSDSIIAATVVQYNLKLWTLNTKHYPMLGDELVS